MPIPARLDIGTIIPVGAPYFVMLEHGSKSIAMDELRELLEAELRIIPATVWAQWENLSVPGVNPTEVEVRNEIVHGLDILNGDPGATDRLQLTGGNLAATPHSVRVVWRDGRYIRIHSYRLDVMRMETGTWRQWAIVHRPPGGTPVTIELCADLSWEIAR